MTNPPNLGPIPQDWRERQEWVEQQAAFLTEQITISRLDYEQRMTDHEQRTTDHEQRMTDHEQRMADHERHMADHDRHMVEIDQRLARLTQLIERFVGQTLSHEQRLAALEQTR